MRSFLAALALLVPSPTSTAVPDLSVIKTGAIVRIACPIDGGYSMGTAFRIGPHLLVTAKHVILFDKCYYASGGRVTVTYSSPSSDYALLSDSGTGPFIKVDCGGFVKGRKYLAAGYARGAPFLTTVELIATGASADGFAILSGIFTVIPGQSGGSIMDEETGAVVGIVNVYQEPEGISGSVELKGTQVCARKSA